MNSLISVIVPVYNVEKYVKRCIDSLVSQTYSNIEIILVDDGSDDLSGDICDKEAKKDERIAVIHKKNAGVSKARNAALDIMKGDFVTFVDADDYVDANYINYLYETIEAARADISTCGHSRVNFDGTVQPVTLTKDRGNVIAMTGKESIINLFYGRMCSASSGSKLYKKELFDNLRFPDYIMGEDTFVVYHAFLEADMIAHTNKPLYYYVQHSGSVTNRKSNYFKFYDYVRLYDHIVNSDPNKDDSGYFAALANRLVENNFWVYMKLRNCPDMFFNEKKHITDNIKKYRKYVINNPNAQPRVKIACLLSYGGMHFLNAVYDRINKKI